MLGQLGLAELPLDVWVDDAGLLRRFVIDLEASSGMQDFQELVLSLKEDRGFV